jgi:hypothetical protein
MSNRGAVVARIISEYSDKGTKAAAKDLQKFSKESHGFGKQFEEVGKKLMKAFAVVEIAKFGFEAIKTAEAVNGAFSKMNIAFANTGSALNSNSPQVQALVEHMTGLAFTSAETADALARGATSFHSAGAAMNNMGLAADVARTTGMGLSEAMVALGKASTGKVPKSLAALGVIMPKNGTAAEKYKSITDQLTKSLEGQAEAYAQTHPIETMKAKFEELTNSIGQLLLPVFSAIVKVLDKYVIPILVKMINFLRQHPEYLQPVVDAFVKFINVLAKVGVVVLDIASAFAKADSVVLQVVRGIAFLTGNKGMEDWAKNAADALGHFSKFIKGAADKLDKFHMNAIKLKATDPIVIKSLGNMTKGIDVLTTSTSKLTAQQIKALDNLKKLGVVPTTSTDPIELEAARLNLVKQNNIEATTQFELMLKNIQAMNDASTAAGRYSDILGVLADQTISTSEIETLAQKWGIPTNSVVTYIAQVIGAGKIPGLDTPGNVAAQGWKNALGPLNDYLKLLNSTSVVGGTGAPSGAGGGSTGGPMPGGGAQPMTPQTSVASFAATIAANGGYANNTNAFGADRAGGQGVAVTVNVGGSVITHNDITSALRDSLLNGILSGKPTSFSSVGL